MFVSSHLAHHISNLLECLTFIHSFVISQYEKATPAQVRVHLLEEHKQWKVPERRVAKFVKRFRRAPGSAAGNDDDDMSMMSVASSVSQRAKSAVKGVRNILHLRTRSKNKGDKESAGDHPPVPNLLDAMSPHDDGVSEVHEDDPLDSLLFSSPMVLSKETLKASALKENIKESQTDDSEAATAFVTALESVGEEAEAEVNGRSLAFADDDDGLAFTDDNDGLAFTDDNDGKKEGGFCEPCEGCNIL